MVQRKKKRPTKRKPRRTVRPRKQEYPGWLWMVFGLAIGLSVAFAVYMRDAPPTVQEVAQSAASSPPAGALDNNSESPAAATQSEPPRRFDFYNMLPNFEVIIPEEEPEVEVDREPKAIEAPGVYVLQAGSFSSYGDADRRRAQLALQGIESRIQRVSIDDKTYHRVRIGPISDLEELNVTRSRLRAAKIDVLRIRLGD
jgi:cell division protein FtsN